MPIVFVHGVNNRMDDPGYETRRRLIERFLKDHLSGATVNGKALATANTAFPYWGDLATKFAWNMASVPPMNDGAQALGSVDEDMRAIVATIHDRLGELAPGQEQPLTAVAEKSLSDAVELISDILLSTPIEEDGDAESIAKFVADAQTYAEQNPAPAWLAGVTTDQQLIAELLPRVTEAHPVKGDVLGNPFQKIGNWLGAAANKVKTAVKKAVVAAIDRTGDYASTKVLGSTRISLNGTLGRFFGDIFVYLDERGDIAKPGAIPERILPDLVEKATEPLVIVGHSLGGVITYDLLTHYIPNRQVDLLVTVGSQISHFEEMKRFHVSDRNVPSNGVPKVGRPRNVKHWINIFDPVDIFSYACEPVFDGVKDYDYDTRTYVIKAHGAYFDQKRFYVRLRDRIDNLPK